MIAYCGGFLIATTSAGFVQLNIDFDTDDISVRGYANIAKHYITEWFDSFNIGSIPGFIELKSKIDKLLNSREKVIIEMRYGLNDEKVKTQNEIAKMLGISRSYVSRIENAAIHKLSKEIEKD